ncbi:hypothetical protein Pst134EA_032820 [Puccinia striiformis f. sp. tritici]|uniref:uncharacterized protein n=1 Tax=Puccinia striiformis f. sp. tritici TaxID=168172 RepID=UPI002007C7DF|nr:uncharacterized protein Pst134EA_032820 [Puccinia striiformis f. sp. tritici]KAH9441593.1 hypothetical protein Pst134EA_032820 [Puccinia striiformis f. sp. tritici]
MMKQANLNQMFILFPIFILPALFYFPIASGQITTPGTSTTLGTAPGSASSLSLNATPGTTPSGTTNLRPNTIPGTANVPGTTITTNTPGVTTTGVTTSGGTTTGGTPTLRSTTSPRQQVKLYMPARKRSRLWMRVRLWSLTNQFLSLLDTARAAPAMTAWHAPYVPVMHSQVPCSGCSLVTSSATDAKVTTDGKVNPQPQNCELAYYTSGRNGDPALCLTAKVEVLQCTGGCLNTTSCGTCFKVTESQQTSQAPSF